MKTALNILVGFVALTIALPLLPLIVWLFPAAREAARECVMCLAEAGNAITGLEDE